MRRALAAVALVIGGCQHGAAPAPRATCPAAPVHVSSQAELDRLAGCARLAGLTVASAAPLDLAPLAALTTVDGDLRIGPTLALSSVGLPALAEVGGAVAVVASGSVGGVYLPTLARAGALEVRDDAALTTVAVPRLAAVGGDVTLARVPALTYVDASALASIGGALTVVAPALDTWLGSAPAVSGAVDARAPGWPPR